MPSLDANLTLCLPRLSSGLSPKDAIIATTVKPTTIPPNHVLIKVDRFGFSANNVTYQALGEAPHFRYFDFNPAPEVGNISPNTHGLVPVWGFGTIDISTHPKIHAGERVYGYFAPTRYLLVPVSSNDVSKYSFYVPRPHLPADRRPYNQIIRCATDPQYSSDPFTEDLTMLYRPLFWTSYWFEDWLFSSKYRAGASHILISSASSKTAFSLAYLIGKRIARGEIDANVKIVGLTSKRNISFTKSLNLYHEVLEYGSFAKAPVAWKEQNRWIYVDVAGNNSLNQTIFSHFASPYTGKIAACVALGMTTLSPSSNDSKEFNVNTTPFVSSPSTGDTSPFWPQIEHFFMVEWLDVRRRQMAPTEMHAQQNDVWQQLVKDGSKWVHLERVYGADQVGKAYGQIASDGLGPETGFIWSMWDRECERVSAKL